MASKTAEKKSTTAKAKDAPKPKRVPLTRSQAEAAMKKNEKAYKEYQVARGKGVERSKNPHATGYKAYKNAYRDLLEIKRAAGEIKPRQAKQEPTAPAAEAEATA